MMTEEDKAISNRWSSAQLAYQNWSMTNTPRDPIKKAEADIWGAKVRAEYYAAMDAYNAMIDRLAGRSA